MRYLPDSDQKVQELHYSVWYRQLLKAEYIAQKKLRDSGNDKIDNMKDDLDNLKNEINEIKSLLKELVNV